MRPFGVPVVILALLAYASAAAALSITLNPGSGTTSLISEGRDGFDLNTDVVATPTTVPVVDSDTADFDVGESTTDYDFSSSALMLGFDNFRAGTTSSFSRSRGDIFFSVDAAIDYLLSGSYSSLDEDGNVTQFEVELVDLTTSTTLMDSEQESGSTVDESFVLGGSGGDFSNLFTGSLTGTLVAGREYRLSYVTNIANVSGNTESTAHGTGFAMLTFVPEPSTGLLLAAGLALVSVGRRRAR